jgi:DNA-binding MarR family transcriptional regulator
LTAWPAPNILSLVLNINEKLRDKPLQQGAASSGSEHETLQGLIGEIQEAMATARAAGMRQGFQNLMGRSVSMTHMHVLAKLRMAGSLPMSRLADALDVSVASATGIVSRMEERGLVERSRPEGDRRVVLVAMAPGGTGALEEIDARGREFFGRILQELTMEELVQLRNGFAAMHRASQKVIAEQMAVERTAEGKPASKGSDA